MTRVHCLTSLLILTLSFLVACTEQANEQVTSTSSTADGIPSSTPPSPSISTTTSPGDEFIPDYAALIAAVESAMESTTYEGAALEDPEVFIATAELFCDLLEEGMTAEELLSEYLDRLSDGGSVDVDEEDGLMAGVLLGASIEIVCPEYS